MMKLKPQFLFAANSCMTIAHAERETKTKDDQFMYGIKEK